MSSQFASHFVQGQRLRFHYLEAGKADNVILLLHGWTGAATDWKPLMGFLAADHHVYSPDLRGAGDTEKPGDGYSLDSLVEDTRDFAQALKLPPFTLVGHSMGGITAFLFAAKYPEFVRRLVLVGAAPSGGLNWGKEELQESIDVFLSRDAARLREANLAFSFGPGFSDEAALAELVEANLKVSTQHIADLAHSMNDARYESQLAKVRAPTLVVHGDRDAAVPLDSSLRYFRSIEGAGLAVIYNSGHTPHVERPEQFQAALAQFLQDTGG